MAEHHDSMKRLMQKVEGKKTVQSKPIAKAQSNTNKTTTVNASSKKRGCGCKRRKK